MTATEGLVAAAAVNTGVAIGSSRSGRGTTLASQCSSAACTANTSIDAGDQSCVASHGLATAASRQPPVVAALGSASSRNSRRSRATSAVTGTWVLA